jgi:cytochrome b561
MNWKNTQDRYASLSIGMHWLMLLLMIGVYAAINLADAFPKGSTPRADLKTWHFALGLCVMGLVALRLATRLLSGPAPRIEPQAPAWPHRLAAWAHVALYAFMIVMPVLGWLAVSAKGAPIEFFGLPLPALIGQDKELARSVKEVHETIGTIGYFLIGLHAAAALAHHYLWRDNTLLRMLPARR